MMWSSGINCGGGLALLESRTFGEHVKKRRLELGFRPAAAQPGADRVTHCGLAAWRLAARGVLAASQLRLARRSQNKPRRATIRAVALP